MLAFSTSPHPESEVNAPAQPQVTISLATFRGFPWRKVPVYILSQLLGGIVGAAIVYANYHSAIDLFEGGHGVRTVPGTASLFGTYAVRVIGRTTRT